MVKSVFLTILLFSSVLKSSSESNEEGWFWHVTDFHWDFSYWTQQLSCNGKNITQTGQFGDQWCDSPWELVADTIKGLPLLKSQVDFILWTGDTVPHVSEDHLSLSLSEELVRNVTLLMNSTFPNTPVIPTFGNHDYYPNGQFPPNGNVIYNDTYTLWKWWINDIFQEADFLKGGYYSVHTPDRLRIIALNTNLYYTSDKVTPTLDDPADQFKWLDKQLTRAEQASEKVIITGHVPPGFVTPRGVMWMTGHFNKRFNEIILRHSSVIRGLHFGHEHNDNFRLYYDGAGKPLVSLFIAPSVTPWRYKIGSLETPAHNPGARLIKYDRKTGNHLDIVQYYIDLDESNAKGSLVWQYGYNATSLYKIPDVTPGSMNDAVTRMGNRKGPEFLAYVNWYNTNGTQNFPCDAMCHQTVMCGLKHMEEAPFKACLNDFPIPPDEEIKTDPNSKKLQETIQSVLNFKRDCKI